MRPPAKKVAQTILSFPVSTALPSRSTGAACRAFVRMLLNHRCSNAVETPGYQAMRSVIIFAVLALVIAGAARAALAHLSTILGVEVRR